MHDVDRMHVLSLQKPRRVDHVDQSHALKTVTRCRADWKGDAALLPVFRRADGLEFSCRASEVPSLVGLR